MRNKIFSLLLLLSINSYSITLNEVPKVVILQNEDGGLISDSSAWHSTSLKDKVWVVFYVDPDEKDLNKKFTTMLKDEQFNDKYFKTIAIINYAATWKPNFILESVLKNKQKEFPRTIYVKDNNKVLVKQWGLKDNSYDVIVFSKNGKVLFYESGQMSYDDMLKALQIIKNNI